MRVSSAPCTAFPRRGERPFTFKRCLLGVFLATLAFLLFTFSGKSLKRLRTPTKDLEPRVWVDLGLTQVGVEGAARVLLGMVH